MVLKGCVLFTYIPEMYAMVLVWVGCALVGLVLLQHAARAAVGSEAATAVADGASALGDAAAARCPDCDEGADDCSECAPAS